MLRITIVLLLSSSLAGQGLVHEQRSPARLDDTPALRALHRQLRADDLRQPIWNTLLRDCDGDGLVDVLVGASSSAALHRGLGDGLFRAVWSTEGAGGLLAEDVDGDGRLDLVRGEELFRGDGAGGFTLVPGALPAWSRPRVLGDLDGDGDPDALGVQPNLSFVLLTNDGHGLFGQSVLATLPRSVSAIALGDLDGDSDLDAVLAEHGQSQLFLGDGAGGFVEATANLPLDSAESEALALGDLDGDGDLDVVIAGGTHDDVWFGNGDGTFDPLPSVVSSLSWTLGVALADVDGDGDLDLYGATGPPPPPEVLPEPDFLLLNEGDGTFGPASVGLPLPRQTSRAVTAGDADQDGDVDLVVSGDAVRLLLGDGSGRFWLDDGGLPATTSADDGVLLADLDGDGWCDVLTTSTASNGGPAARVLLGDGSGSFRDDPARITPAARPALCGAVGDVDGDGDLDLALANPYDGEWIARAQDNQLYRNDGGGSFSDVSASALPVYLEDRGVTRRVALFDVEGDGDLDLAFADVDDYDGGGGGLTVYANDGAGTFAEAGTWSGSYQGLVDFHVVDLEDDGDPDVVFEDALFGLGLLQNDGTGSFTDESARLPGANGYQDRILWSVAADLDGDGDPDLAGVAANPLSGVFGFWYAGDGLGSFSDASFLLPAHVRTYVGALLGYETYAAADLDGDGDLDLVSQASLLENDGSGRLCRSLRPIQGPADARAVAFGDLDADGDLDAVWAARHDVVGSNPMRQVAARSLPRVGKTLALDVFGQRTEPWLLAGSTGRAQLVLGIGLLQLEPTALVPVAAGRLGNRGRAQWSVAVPDDPFLEGLTLYWQALVGAPPRLSNLEPTTLAAY